MSELLRDPLIMSVGEFRKLTGEATDRFNDEQVVRLIIQLNFIAELFIEGINTEKEIPNDDSLVVPEY